MRTTGKWTRRLAVAAASSGLVIGATAVDGTAPAGATATNPFAPANGHSYRHGAVPSIGQAKKSRAYAAAHPAGPAGSANTLSYGGGGTDGIGVTSGKPQVYLVFWGSQWGGAGTNSNGDTTFSSDKAGAAPYVQELFKGLGTGNEQWSGTMTQYCDGSVSLGATSCPPGTAHVVYPAGGAYAGVWYDNAAAAPTAPTAHQLAQEAVNAAGHFNAAPYRYAQFDILSAPGMNPDGYKTGGFCAWHDDTGDSTMDGGGAVSSPYGALAFTNMPYILDVGASCGANFVSAPLDGFSIVNGHEFAETVTDQNPGNGWYNFSTGAENGDECAWITPGTPGGAADVTTGTGSFAMQSTWSNDTNSCAISHAIITSGNSVTVTNPGNQTTAVGSGVSLQIHATDSATGQTLTYAATGLPSGLTINSSTGLISGTANSAANGTVTVTATDTTGAQGSTSFNWKVVAPHTITVTNPGNQSTRVGSSVHLQIQATDSTPGQTLTYSSSGLPKGLSISSTTGLISGSPSTVGTSAVTVTVSDGTGYGTASFTWTIRRR